MRDEGIVATGGTLADQAVDYMLKRIAKDSDLRWLMIGTEAYSKLRMADEARKGQVPSEDQLLALTMAPPPNSNSKRPRLLSYSEALEKLAQYGDDENKHADRTVYAEVREIADAALRADY